MANTGILLRKDFKANFNDVQTGEIVFAQDTNELGMLINGELYWQNWIDVSSSANYLFTGDDLPDDSLAEDGDKYIQKKDIGGSIELVEFKKESGAWRELQKGMADQTWADNNLETNIHNENLYPYLGKYGYKMADGYSPTEPLDVATKAYMDSIPGGTTGLVRLDGTTPMNTGYVPTLDGDVVTPNYLLSGDAEILIPTTQPDIAGAIWNNNGTLSLSSEYLSSYTTTFSADPVDSDYFGGIVETNGEFVFVNDFDASGYRKIVKYDLEMNVVGALTDLAPFGEPNYTGYVDFKVSGNNLLIVVNKRVFILSTIDFSLLHELTPAVDANIENRSFGSFIAISADRILVSDYTSYRLDNVDDNHEFGCVYIYDTSGNYIETVHSHKTDSNFTHRFGKIPRIFGNELYIGEMYYGIDPDYGIGAIHIYDLNGNFLRRHIGSVAYIAVGYAYTVVGDKIIYAGADSGRAFYRNNDGTGVETEISLPVDGNYNFASAIYDSGRHILITNWGASLAPGRVYMYNRDTIALEGSIYIANAGYAFGDHISANGRKLYISDYSNGINGYRQGAVYAYQ